MKISAAVRINPNKSVKYNLGELGSAFGSIEIRDITVGEIRLDRYDLEYLKKIPELKDNIENHNRVYGATIVIDCSMPHIKLIAGRINQRDKLT